MDDCRYFQWSYGTSELSGVVVKETKRFFDVYADQKMANKKSSASIKDAAEN